MGFLHGRGTWTREEYEVWERETVLRMRRVREHPQLETSIAAFHLALNRMHVELVADAKGEPRPARTVEETIREMLAPIGKREAA